MEIMLWFLVPSLITVAGCKWYFRETICPREMMAQTAIAIVMAAVAMGISYMSLHQSVYETNLVHGEVTGKWMQEVSCSHSYSCPPCHQECTTYTVGSGKSKSTRRSCRQVCSTCYDHNQDYDWRVATSFGTYEIDRIDRQGKNEPPRWTSVKNGDPVTGTYGTENWLKASENLLLPKKVDISEEQLKEIPKAPYVFDYYNTNLVTDLLPNTIPVDTSGWNQSIRQWERKAGPEKHVSVWLILTDKDFSFSDRLLWAHRGGQKNEVIMIYGVKADGTVGWFRGHSFANGMNNNTLLQKLRQDALGQKLDYTVVEKQLQNILTDFKRQPAKEFKDLLFENLSVSWWLIAILIILQQAALIFVARQFHELDFFEGSRAYRLRNSKQQ